MRELVQVKHLGYPGLFNKGTALLQANKFVKTTARISKQVFAFSISHDKSFSKSMFMPHSVHMVRAKGHLSGSQQKETLKPVRKKKKYIYIYLFFLKEKKYKIQNKCRVFTSPARRAGGCQSAVCQPAVCQPAVCQTLPLTGMHRHWHIQPMDWDSGWEISLLSMTKT